MPAPVLEAPITKPDPDKVIVSVEDDNILRFIVVFLITSTHYQYSVTIVSDTYYVLNRCDIELS